MALMLYRATLVPPSYRHRATYRVTLLPASYDAVDDAPYHHRTTIVPLSYRYRTTAHLVPLFAPHSYYHCREQEPRARGMGRLSPHTPFPRGLCRRRIRATPMPSSCCRA